MYSVRVFVFRKYEFYFHRILNSNFCPKIQFEFLRQNWKIYVLDFAIHQIK